MVTATATVTDRSYRRQRAVPFVGAARCRVRRQGYAAQAADPGEPAAYTASRSSSVIPPHTP